MNYTAWRIPLGLAVCLGAGICLAAGGDYFPPADKDGGWRTLPDAAKIRSVAGMDLSRLDDPAKAEITLGQLLSMSSGLHGEGSNPGFVNGVGQKLDPVTRPPAPLDQDMSALRTPLWTKPGGGYSYASSSPHIASIIIRN